MDLDEVNIKLENKESEIDKYRREINNLQSLVLGKKTVLQDLKRGYEYGLDTYQTNENQRICSEIDNILYMVDKAQKKQTNSEDLQEENKPITDAMTVVKVPMTPADTLNSITSKIMDAEMKVQHPSLHCVKSHMANEFKDDQTLDESTFDTPAKVSRK